MRMKVWIPAGMLLVVVALLAGCTQSTGGLKVLRADPMASASPVGLASQNVIERDGGVTFGKETPSSLLRQLHVADPAAALVELDKDAKAAGWVVDKPLTITGPAGSAIYTRVADGRSAGLTMVWVSGDQVDVALSTAGAASRG